MATDDPATVTIDEGGSMTSDDQHTELRQAIRDLAHEHRGHAEATEHLARRVELLLERRETDLERFSRELEYAAREREGQAASHGRLEDRVDQLERFRDQLDPLVRRLGKQADRLEDGQATLTRWKDRAAGAAALLGVLGGVAVAIIQQILGG